MKTTLLLGLSAAFATLFAVETASASCGSVEVAKGDVKIESGQTKQAAAAAVGAKICSGDTIVTGPDSRAKLKMEDGNELNVSPDSKIVLETYQYNPAENKKKVLLNLLQGKVRAATKQEGMYGDKAKDGADNSFQVKTKSAVAGVRGTDWLTGYDTGTGKTDVVTFRGKVEVGTPGPGGRIMNSVMVGAGQKTEASSGSGPAQPKKVPAKELNQMNSESKSDGGGSADKGTSGGGDKKADKEDKKDGDKGSGDKADNDKGGGDKADGDKGSGEKKQAGGRDGGSRRPSSSGSMVGQDEQSGDPTVKSADTRKEGGDNHPPPPPPPPPPKPPTVVLIDQPPKPPTIPTLPDQVKDVISNGPTKLKIIVNIK